MAARSFIPKHLPLIHQIDSIIIFICFDIKVFKTLRLEVVRLARITIYKSLFNVK